MQNFALILDFGTSKLHVNAICLENGKIACSLSSSYFGTSKATHIISLEPKLVWKTAQHTVSRLLQLLPEPKHILFISFSFAGDNLMLADINGQPCTDFFMYSHPCAKDEAIFLSSLFGRKYIEWTGEECLNSSAPSRLLHIKNNFPELYQKSYYFWSLQQWILFRLGLEPVNDFTLAARKGLMDNRTGNWITEMTAFLEISDSQLGSVLPACSVIGKIDRFGETAFSESVPVILGAHDCLCSFYGLGVYDEAEPIIANNSGTFDHFGYIASGYVNCKLSNSETSLCSYPGNGLSTSLCISNTLDHGISAEQFALKYCHGDISESFHFLWNDTANKFSVSFRDFMQSCTFASRKLLNDCISQKRSPTTRLRAGGGGSHSPELMQLKADIYQLPVECTTNGIEASSVGAAILGALATGYYSSICEATSHMVHITHIYYPASN